MTQSSMSRDSNGMQFFLRNSSRLCQAPLSPVAAAFDSDLVSKYLLRGQRCSLFRQAFKGRIALSACSTARCTRASSGYKCLGPVYSKLTHRPLRPCILGAFLSNGNMSLLFIVDSMDNADKIKRYSDHNKVINQSERRNNRRTSRDNYERDYVCFCTEISLVFNIPYMELFTQKFKILSFFLIESPSRGKGRL